MQSPLDYFYGKDRDTIDPLVKKVSDNIATLPTGITEGILVSKLEAKLGRPLTSSEHIILQAGPAKGDAIEPTEGPITGALLGGATFGGPTGKMLNVIQGGLGAIDSLSQGDPANAALGIAGRTFLHKMIPNSPIGPRMGLAGPARAEMLAERLAGQRKAKWASELNLERPLPTPKPLTNPNVPVGKPLNFKPTFPEPPAIGATGGVPVPQGGTPMGLPPQARQELEALMRPKEPAKFTTKLPQLLGGKSPVKVTKIERGLLKATQKEEDVVNVRIKDTLKNIIKRNKGLKRTAKGEVLIEPNTPQSQEIDQAVKDALSRYQKGSTPPLE